MPSAPAKNKAPATNAADAATRGTRVGVVESDKCDKTRKVVVQFWQRHPKYGKFMRRRTVLHVHDEQNLSHMGDRVEVAQCRPRSKTKTWSLVRVVEKAAGTAAVH